MKLEKLWLVRNSSAVSTLEDICWEQEVGRLGLYVWGSGQGAWEREKTTVYTDRDEAVADAMARLERLARNAWRAAHRTADSEDGQQIVDAMDLPDLATVGEMALVDWPAGVAWGSYDTRRDEKEYEVRFPELIHPAYVVRTA